MVKGTTRLILNVPTGRNRYTARNRVSALKISTAVAINAKIAVSKTIANPYGLGGVSSQLVLLQVPPSQYGTVS
jgi:hypothetical protein